MSTERVTLTTRYKAGRLSLHAVISQASQRTPLLHLLGGLLFVFFFLFSFFVVVEILHLNSISPLVVSVVLISSRSFGFTQRLLSCLEHQVITPPPHPLTPFAVFCSKERQRVGPGCRQGGNMSRFDMKDFGEAAPFLRKSELEQLTVQTIAFDGRPPSPCTISNSTHTHTKKRYCDTLWGSSKKKKTTTIQCQKS